MRTYTVRDVRGAGADTRLVVDFVLHLDEGRPGRAPPGPRRPRSATGWSRRAAARATFRRHRVPARTARRCCSSPTRPRYRPCAASSRTCRRRPRHGVPRGARRRATCWSGGARRGRGRLAAPGRRPAGIAAARCRAGPPRRAGRRGRGAGGGRPGPVGDPDVLLLGRGRRGHRADRGPRPGRRVRLDRRRVGRGHQPAPAPGQGAGMDRRQVAFMGYWRRGVAMRS